MKILIGLLSLVVLSESLLYDVITPKTTEKFDWLALKDLISKTFEQTTPQPTTSTEFEKSSDPNKDTSFLTSSETPEELFDRLVKELDSDQQASSHISNHENIIPLDSPNMILTTRPTTSPPPVSQTKKLTVPPRLNNKATFFPNSVPAYSGPESFNYPSIYNFQNSHPYTPQQELPPVMHSIPEELPFPYDPYSFYNQQNWKSPGVSSSDELPFYPPSEETDEIPIHSLDIPYEVAPPHPQRPLNHLPQVPTGPFINYNMVPFFPSSDSGPFQTYSFSPYSQNYGAPGRVISTFVRTYIPRNQFQHVQFPAPQTPIVPVQPSQYVPSQLSQEDILSLILNSHQSQLPAVSSHSYPPHSVPTNIYQPNFSSYPTYSGKDSVPKSYKSPTKTAASSSYYKDQISPVRPDGINPPDTIIESPQPLFYGNPINLHIV